MDIIRGSESLLTHDLYDVVSVVASIEETAEKYSIPKPFIGLILIPLVVRSTCSVGPQYSTHPSTHIHISGQRSRTRHVCLDGHEGQDGVDDWDFYRQFDCEPPFLLALPLPKIDS